MIQYLTIIMCHISANKQKKTMLRILLAESFCVTRLDVLKAVKLKKLVGSLNKHYPYSRLQSKVLLCNTTPGHVDQITSKF